MIDSILSGVLAISVLLGGTAAFGVEASRAAQDKPLASNATVSLPMVTVVGHRHPEGVLIALR